MLLVFFLSHFILFSNSLSRVQNCIDYEHQRKHTNRIGRAELLLCLTLSWKYKNKKKLKRHTHYSGLIFLSCFYLWQTVYRPSAACYHIRIRCNYLNVLFYVVFCRSFIYSWQKFYRILSILTTFLCCFFLLYWHS